MHVWTLSEFIVRNPESASVFRIVLYSKTSAFTNGPEETCVTKDEFSKLAHEYEHQTRLHSFAHMMEETPTFKSLLAGGDQIVPWIIDGFTDHVHNPATGRWGMKWILVLMTVTGTTPIQPQIEDGFQKWSVDKTCKAWIEWYRCRVSG
jgi:hypothetical protein